MPSTLSPAQRRFLKPLLALTLFVLVDSTFLFLTHNAPDLTILYQILLLGHLAGGVLLVAGATAFLVWHLTRVWKLRRGRTVSSGILFTVVTYGLLVSGLFILTAANSRENHWVFVSHQALALLFPALYGLHRLVGHFRPKRKVVALGAVAWGAAVLVLLGAQSISLPKAGAASTKKIGSAYAAKSGKDSFLPFAPNNYPDPKSPFAPSRATTDSMNFLPVRILTRLERSQKQTVAEDLKTYGFAKRAAIGAETCRRCHADIVAQWEDSAHRFASFNNPFYRASVEHMRDDVGKKKSQWCAACHDPAIMLAGNMTKDIKPEIPESQAGLTCLACHAIDKIHGIAGNGGYNIGDEKPSKYLGDSASTGAERRVADYLIKAKPESHKRLMLKPFFKTSEYCSACHKVSLDVPLNDYKYMRGQDEYDHWQASGVSQHAAATFYLPPAPKSCQDCHMPLEKAVLGDVAAKNGYVRSHRFLAANTALPYIRGDKATLKRTEEFLKDGKLRVDIFSMERKDGSIVRALSRSQPVLKAGESIIFDVVIRNKGTGHTFPGGTLDSNEGWIDFRITDDQGKTLYRSGALEKDRTVDPSAHFYRVIFLRANGDVAARRDPYAFHVKSFGRVIGPGTADVARYGVTIPKDLAGRRIWIEAKLNWRKFNRFYTEFVFKEHGLKIPKVLGLKPGELPKLPITTIAQDRITLEVGKKGTAGKPIDDPSLWVRYNDQGIADFLQGAYENAEGSWKEVARLRPDLPDGWRNLARRWIASATPERALQYLPKMDEVAPSDPQKPYFWGRYYERMEEYAKAEDAYEAVLFKVTGAGGKDPFSGDRDTWGRLGAVRFKLHEYEKSLDAYLHVLQIDPENVEAHKKRLDIYRLLGEPEKAAQAAKAFDKYRKDDQAQQIALKFLKDHPEINDDAQPRHVHRPQLLR